MSAIIFVRSLDQTYDAIEPKGVAEVAEQMARFLSEVNAGEEAVIFLNDFIYFRMNYETKTKKRNLKPLFGNPEEGVSEASHSDALKRFKAYVFGLRSNNSPTPPPAWDMVGNADTLPCKIFASNKYQSIGRALTRIVSESYLVKPGPPRFHEVCEIFAGLFE